MEQEDIPCREWANPELKLPATLSARFVKGAMKRLLKLNQHPVWDRNRIVFWNTLFPNLAVNIKKVKSADLFLQIVARYYADRDADTFAFTTAGLLIDFPKALCEFAEGLPVPLCTMVKIAWQVLIEELCSTAPVRQEIVDEITQWGKEWKGHVLELCATKTQAEVEEYVSCLRPVREIETRIKLRLPIPRIDFRSLLVPFEYNQAIGSLGKAALALRGIRAAAQLQNIKVA